MEGRIDERELLKTIQYFKRWGFDYNLYTPSDHTVVLAGNGHLAYGSGMRR